MMTAFNQGPAVAALCDWENGPQSLHGPHMPMWKPDRGVRPAAGPAVADLQVVA